MTLLRSHFGSGGNLTENISMIYMCLITTPFSELILDGTLGLRWCSKDKSQWLGSEAQQISAEVQWKFSNRQGN